MFILKEVSLILMTTISLLTSTHYSKSLLLTLKKLLILLSIKLHNEPQSHISQKDYLKSYHYSKSLVTKYPHSKDINTKML